MKISLTLILSFAWTSLFCQLETRSKIDTSNYYQFLDKQGNLNWLRVSEATPIIIDEIKKAGYSYAFIEIGDLIMLKNGTPLVLTVSYNNDQKFGFVYEGSHGFPLSPNDRSYMTRLEKFQYTQVVKPESGSADFKSIDPLPKNIFLLKQRCYWYNYNSAGDKFPVSKSTAEYILRQDIRYFLKRIKR